MGRFAVVAAVVLALAEGRIRTLVQQQAVGECANDATMQAKYFPLQGLTEYRSLGSAAVQTIDNPITSARLIQLDYGDNFKVLTETFSKEQYVLTQCGTTQPTDADINLVKALPTGYTRKHFTIPLQQVSAESTVHLGFLGALGLHDRVSYVTRNAVDPCWQQSISCGGGVESSNVTLQAEQRSEVDAFFLDCPWDFQTKAPDCEALHSMTKAVHFSASQDPAPLHSAEHVKFIAAFFNKEEAAKTLFDARVSTMKVMMDQSNAAKNDEPVVAWIAKTWDGKFTLSTAAYKEHYVKYAGGKAVDAAAVKAAMGNEMDESYTTTNASALFESMMDVDAVIDETYSPDVATYDFSTFLTGFGITASSDLPFIKNKKVFRVDAQISGNSNLDWFESRLPHPELAVEGLQRVLKPDSSKGKKFFRNIAIGEGIDVLDKAACTASMPTCSPSAVPAALPMLTTLERVSTTTATVESTRTESDEATANFAVVAAPGYLAIAALALLVEV